MSSVKNMSEIIPQPQVDQGTTNQKQVKQQHMKVGDDDDKTVQSHPLDAHGLSSEDGKHHFHELVDCQEYDDGSGDVTGKCCGMTQQAHHFRCVD